MASEEEARVARHELQPVVIDGEITTITYDPAIGGSRTYYRDEPPKEGK